MERDIRIRSGDRRKVSNCPHSLSNHPQTLAEQREMRIFALR